MTDKTATALNGRGTEISHVAEKRLILMTPAGGSPDGRKKIAALRLFLSLRDKKQLISMAPARGLAGWPKK